MYHIRSFNTISPKGLARLPHPEYQVVEKYDDALPAHAILLRSYPLTPADIPPSIVAIARAGSGVNNIPIAHCTERGIPVFNTPGANANAVRELVVAALLLSCRNILGGVNFITKNTMNTESFTHFVENNKKRFKGEELTGKTMGIVGLGAVGNLVAHSALHFGMHVCGYDPALSVEAAWRLPGSIKRMEDMHSLVAQSDYVSLHMPLNSSTRHIINKKLLHHFRTGARLLNFSRAEIIHVPDLLSSLNEGKLAGYVTDFPDPVLIGQDKVILFPHLGACTQEAEENCAMMAAELLKDFIENGIIKYSVNFPSIYLELNGDGRIVVCNQNIPNMINQITAILSDENINVVDMVNKSHGEVACNLIDTEGIPSPASLQRMRAVEGVSSVRMIEWQASNG